MMGGESRRPIKARSIGLIQKLAAALARSSITPNQISVASVVFSLLVPLGLLTWGPGWAGCLVAALGIQLRLLCNLLDGMVAVEGGKQSLLGDLFNEVPDRISDTVILLGFAFAASGSLYVYVLAWAAAFLSVLTAYLRVLGASLGTRHYYSGPMAKQHRMALLTFVLLILPLTGHHSARVVATTLVVIALGACLTCVRRLSRIGHELQGGEPR